MNILCVTYGGGHANMLLPVVKSLVKHKGVCVKVLALTTARAMFEREGIACFSFRDLDRTVAVNSLGEELVEGLGGGHPDVPFEESVAYMGLSYDDLVQKYGEKQAARLYQAKGRHAFLPVALMMQVIVEGGYDVVVATNSPRAEQAAIIAAGNLGVPALCMVDLFAIQGVKWLGQKDYADKVCVLSKEVKTLLCAAGRQDKEIVVTGNPSFDRLADSGIQKRGAFLRREKGWEEKKVVLWCSQPEPKQHPFTGKSGEPRLPLMVEKSLRDVCCSHKDWHLFVRPHPSENLESRVYLDGVEYGRDDDLAVLLKAVDVVVVTSSTVGLEAVLLNKPVVALSMSLFSADMPFADMGMAVGVDNLLHLEVALEGVLSGAAALKVELPKVGMATQAVCHEVLSLLDSQYDV